MIVSKELTGHSEVSLGVVNPVEHVRPALQCDALEHGQHGLAEVVKAGDPPLGALPVLPALVLLLAAVQAATRVGILHHLPWNKDVEILTWSVPHFSEIADGGYSDKW